MTKAKLFSMRINLIIAATLYMTGFGLIWTAFLMSDNGLLLHELIRVKSLLNSSISKGHLFLSGIICLAIGYFFLLRWAFHESAKLRIGQYYIFFLLFLFFFLPPFLSTDVISYYQQGWVEAYQKANPYFSSPGDFANAPGRDLLFNGYNLYVFTPYGPVWAFILIFAVAKIARFLNPQSELTALILLGAHPLLLIEGPGMAHIDVTSLALIALGIWSYMYLQGRVWISALFLISAALVKAFAIPVLFLFLWWIARDHGKPVKVRFRSIFQAIIVITLSILLTSLFYTTRISDIPRLFGSTMAGLEISFTPVSLLKKLFIDYLKIDSSKVIAGGAAQGFVMVLAISVIFRFIRPAAGNEKAAGMLGPIYMVINFAFSYWRPWYALWPLAMASVLPYRKFSWAVDVYGLFALSTYLITRSSGISFLP